MSIISSARLKLKFTGTNYFNKNEINKLLEGYICNDTPDLVLEVTPEKIQLSPSNPQLSGPVHVDFNSSKFKWRKGQGELINKATGISKNDQLNITDATAGLGIDAFILASAGASITLIEKNPVIYLMLYDGLARAARDKETAKQASRIQLIHDHSETYLTNNITDVVYLDPMYPQTGKSAKSNKRMQLLQQLTDDHSPVKFRLLDSAIQHARYRVVVKRPIKGDYLDNKKPAFSLKGRSTRFDVYTNKSFPKD